MKAVLFAVALSVLSTSAFALPNNGSSTSGGGGAVGSIGNAGGGTSGGVDQGDMGPGDDGAGGSIDQGDDGASGTIGQGDDDHGGFPGGGFPGQGGMQRSCVVKYKKCAIPVSIGGFSFCPKWKTKTEAVRGHDLRRACHRLQRQYGQLKSCEVTCETQGRPGHRPGRRH